MGGVPDAFRSNYLGAGGGDGRGASSEGVAVRLQSPPLAGHERSCDASRQRRSRRCDPQIAALDCAVVGRLGVHVSEAEILEESSGWKVLGGDPRVCAVDGVGVGQVAEPQPDGIIGDAAASRWRRKCDPDLDCTRVVSEEVETDVAGQRASAL